VARRKVGANLMMVTTTVNLILPDEITTKDTTVKTMPKNEERKKRKIQNQTKTQEVLIQKRRVRKHK
jgi:hypothetical protein